MPVGDQPLFLHEEITPNDSTIISSKYEAIVVVGSGDLVLEDIEDTEITYTAVPAMTVFQNFRPKRIKATGTTATTIVGWWARD